MLGRTAVAAVIGIGLVACGSSGSSAPSSSASPTASGSAASPLKGFVLSLDQVRQIEPDDPPVADPVADRGTLLGQTAATLDVCGVAYPSEKLRKQRLQVDYIDNLSRKTASNEVVRYNSTAAATQAYHEISTALQHCTGPQELSDVRPVPSDPALSTEQAAGCGKNAPNSASSQAYGCLFFQFRADMLWAIYVFRPTREEALQQGLALAKLGAAKLASQP
jgi:hypothetical protein